MFQKNAVYFLLMCLLPKNSVADFFEINPRGERFYQQALTHLQNADRELDAITLKPSSVEVKTTNLSLGAEASTQLKLAVPLLEQASGFEHPVAQYRLALIYLTAPGDYREKACSLLEKSLSHGFSPPAVEIASFCYEFSDKPEYEAALERVQANMPNYESYFPQPAMMLACRHEESSGLGFEWGTSLDYQAEVYRLLGEKNRARRSEYFQKAVDINGCYKAKRRIVNKS